MAEPDSEARARRALANAEQRFLAGDVAGARHHGRRALGLAPGLPDAEQALAAYDVHAAAAAASDDGLGLGKLPSWYAVLFLPHPLLTMTQPSGGGVVTHDDVRRQHRRLCLLVHPDKNPSAAADGAFKLVQAAYDALLTIHPPPPPRDEERLRFFQAAKHDEVAAGGAQSAPDRSAAAAWSTGTADMDAVLPVPTSLRVLQVICGTRALSICGCGYFLGLYICVGASYPQS